MAGMKEDFYRRIGTDYHNRRTESFIYRYVRQEKEANLRIRLVQEYQAWRSNPEDGARFAKFLLTDVCGDKNLAKTKDGIRQEIGQIAAMLTQTELAGIDFQMVDACMTALYTKYEWEGEKRNAYVQLASKYQCYKIGEHSDEMEASEFIRTIRLTKAEYVVSVFSFLLENIRVHLNAEDRKKLLMLGRSLSGDEVFAGMRKECDKMKLMIAFASKSPERFSETVEQIYTEQSLSDLTDELLDGLIANDVNTLLYDGGFRPGQKEEGKSRKKDRGLDMLEAYMKEIGIEPFAVSNRGNVVSLQDGKNKSYGEYYTACNQLRDVLNQEKRDTVFIPLVIDAQFGGGIFLIGRKHYLFYPEVAAQMKHSCGFCFVSFINVVEGSAYELDTEDFDFPTMEEAVSWFYMKFDAPEDQLDEFRKYNRMVPKNCPDVFTKFFDHPVRVDAPEEADDVAKHEIEESRMELEAAFRQEKVWERKQKQRRVQ